MAACAARALIIAAFAAYGSAALANDAKEPVRTQLADPIAERSQTADATKAVFLTDFIHRYFEPEAPSGETLVLLHGSGGDEASLVDLARKIAPQARLLGVRGRIVQDGVQRWYKRLTPISFDQEDIRAQADAFAAFLKKAADRGAIDLAKTTFLGYSNGANLIGALTLLHPDLVRKAVLLRAMPVLNKTPQADLSKARFLTVAGEEDELYAPFAPKLVGLLKDHGASVEARTIKSGHLLGDADVKVVSEWLASRAP